MTGFFVCAEKTTDSRAKNGTIYRVAFVPLFGDPVKSAAYYKKSDANKLKKILTREWETACKRREGK